jgi:putative heme-binding domain-containing protein
VRGLGKSRPGALELIKLAEKMKLDPYIIPAAAFALHSSSLDDIKAKAAQLFPLPASKNDKPLPPLAQLLKAKGDAARGKLVFANAGTCAKCHIVGGEGKEVGPNLSEIGGKLSREAMFESILYPSAGISHNYETYSVQLDDGNVVTGILVSETPAEVSIKGIDAIVRTYKRSQIEQMVKQKISLMPADLQKVMTAEELIDVVEYVSTLKKK